MASKPSRELTTPPPPSLVYEVQLSDIGPDPRYRLLHDNEFEPDLPGQRHQYLQASTHSLQCSSPSPSDYQPLLENGTGISTTYDGYSEGGVADLVRGDAATVLRWNIAIHVFINILSSILLAASNYTMQVLGSPTRKEIDNAHQRGDWLAVGVLSMRNWKRIARKRAFLILILGLSSVPLQLFYNAASFKIVVRNRYPQRAISLNSTEYTRLATNTSYVNLTNAQWKSEFSGLYTSAYAGLILIFDSVNETRSTPPTMDTHWFDTVYGQNYILASQINASDWLTYQNWSSNYAYDEQLGRGNPPASVHMTHAFGVRSPAESGVQLSLHYMLVVISVNLFKLLVMLSVLITDRSNYMVTLGDAAASFLSHPDPATAGKCLVEDEEIWNQMASAAVFTNDRAGRETGMKHRQLHNTVDPGGWCTRKLAYYTLIRDEQALFIIVTLFIFALVVLLYISFTGGRAWSWGTSSEGVLSFGSMKSSATATIFNAWLSNMPQLLLSFCYMSINSFCTALAGAQEWNGLGSMDARKSLRVSEPRGQQRGTYFLQLPYRWGVPLIVASTTLHWLLSQTFFMIRVDVYKDSGLVDVASSRSACGGSASSFIVFFALFLGLCSTVRCLASRKFVTSLPQAASNSLIVSAACHPPRDEVDPHLKAVQWGVVQEDVVEGFGHCSLSSRPVTSPKEGKPYC
ncbi:hypothetical protein ST47_g4573 [Ascochyta rabiei]|uniref:DUF6536 domain-containing protein n=1 Tax=Didymella rabiei TaxID=5454 RepID=A0A163FE43_DIDRA|nr:hypothetical protein ST47_g4573 [Ascochyta rabiei]